MARAVALLRALGTAYRRDWTALQSLAGNNFFLLTAFLLGKAGTFVYLIMGLVMLFPLSTDPLRKIPASRMALWPLARREWWLLRLASPAWVLILIDRPFSLTAAVAVSNAECQRVFASAIESVLPDA